MDKPAIEQSMDTIIKSIFYELGEIANIMPEEIALIFLPKVKE